MIIQILQFLLSLSILVVLHEFGHYITAKMFGCRVEKFYLFMDWPYALFKKKIGETEFGIGCAPLGGYVKIAGFVDESMDTDGVEKDPEPWELRGKPAWQRLIVMLGGIIVNLVLAWFIYSMIAFSVGETYIPMDDLEYGCVFSDEAKILGFEDGDRLVSIDDELLVEYDVGAIVTAILFDGVKKVAVSRGGENIDIIISTENVNNVIKNMDQDGGLFIDYNTPWVVGGFMSKDVEELMGDQILIGDRIIKINEFETPFYNVGVVEYLKANSGKEVELIVLREGVFYPLFMRVGDDGLLGLMRTDPYIKYKSYSFLGSFSAGFKKTGNIIDMYWSQIKAIFNPSTGAYKHVGGMITIGSLFPGEWDWLVFWSMTAFLSIILAIMNLLPIPALDGGHALIAIGEMLTGKKLPIKILMPLQIIGMILLLMLVLYANGMDIVRLFN